MDKFWIQKKNFNKIRSKSWRIPTHIQLYRVGTWYLSDVNQPENIDNSENTLFWEGKTIVWKDAWSSIS